MGVNNSCLKSEMDVSEQDEVMPELDPKLNWSHQSNDKLNSREFEEIVLEHTEIGAKMAWRLLAQWRIRLRPNEVNSLVGVALCEAASRFDRSYNTSFRTFLFYHLRGVLIKEIADNVKQQSLFHFEPAFAADGMNPALFSNGTAHAESTPETKLAAKQRVELCQKAYQHLDELEKAVIIRFFIQEESLVKIAQELGYCRCHLSRVKSRALKLLAEMLEPLSPDGSSLVDGDSEQGELNLPFRLRYTGGRGRRKNSQETVQKVASSLPGAKAVA